MRTALAGLGLAIGALLASAPAMASPCDSLPEYRQFDFWVGEWDVTDHGKKIAESSIQRIVGQCIIFENYSEPPDYAGKSFNFYDASLRKWRQTWVDSNGGVSEFTGGFQDGAMRLEGETHRANGKRVLRRMVLSPLERGRVRQYSERSLDEGKTWGVAYDYVYVPRARATDDPYVTVRADLERQYSRIAAAYFRGQPDSVLALRTSDFSSIAPNGEIWSTDRTKAYTRASFEQVERTLRLSFAIRELTVRGDTAAAEIHQQWGRLQRKAGQLRIVDTSADQRETWIRTPSGWLLHLVDDVRPGAWIVDGKRIDPSKPYDPAAPAYRPESGK
jgi:hypothetical protein